MATEAKDEQNQRKAKSRDAKMDKVKENESNEKYNVIKVQLNQLKATLEDGYKKDADSKLKQDDIISTKLPDNQNNLENVLGEFKLTGRYHLKFFILISFLCILSSGTSSNYIFSAENVSYRCNYSNCINSESLWEENNSTLDFKCKKYELFNYTETCTLDNLDTSRGSACNEWVYEKDNSFVAEFNLGCQDWKRTLVGTMHSIGFMLGLLFIGPMSDKIGRKKLIIFNTLAAGVVGISRSLITSYWLFIALELIEPLIGENYAATYTMAIEMVTKKHRPIMVLIVSVSNTVGLILMAVLAYFAPNWRTFLVLLYTPAFIFIIYIFLLDESLRWLLIKGKKAEAEKAIRQAAKTNNIIIEEYKILNLKCEDNSNTSFLDSLKVTFSSRKLFIRLLLCICIWFTGLFNSYSLLINSVSLEGNKYINFSLVALCNTTAGLILLYVLPTFKRKGPLILSLTMTGVFCVSQSFVPKGYGWASTLLYICGKINSSITIKMSYLYTTELFPTYTRNTMLALCSCLGRFGAILAPLTPLLIKYWSGLPLFLVGVLSLVTASVVTLMPDTSDDVLPDDVKQAEAVGTKLKKKETCNL